MNIANRCASIYVSHHSEKYIDRFLPRHRQELGGTVLIVNSTPEAYGGNRAGAKCLEARQNVGFAAANNLGIAALSSGAHEFVIFVNPDVTVPAGWLNAFAAICDLPEHRDVGAFTGPLLGYSFPRDEPTGLVDSLGIWRTGYGKWFDKQQGQPATAPRSIVSAPVEIPAVCGALMVVRTWRTLLHPGLVAYHCRGWNPDRSAMPKWTRSISSRNELKMHLRHQWRGVPYSLFKYLYVKLIER
jgi:N-acetylglucosaminyl-diphospho-decaprenol L-rhamnosyltransferase